MDPIRIALAVLMNGFAVYIAFWTGYHICEDIDNWLFQPDA